MTVVSNKRQQLLDAALELLVEQGIQGAATSKIAKKAGVATGTLFHHFHSKQELINQLYLDIKSQLAEAMTKPLSQIEDLSDLKETTKALWNAAIDWSIANPLKLRFFLQFYHSPHLDSEIRAKAVNEILGFIGLLLKQGVEKGIMAEYPEDLILDLCQGQFLSTAAFLIENPDKAFSDEYRQAAFNIFWNAIRI